MKYVFLLIAAAFTPSLAWSKIDPSLKASIETGNAVPVIVEFRSSPGIDTAIGKQRLQERAAAIALLVNQALSASPLPTSIISRRYAQLPMIALDTIDPPDLTALLRNPRVKAIYPDLVMRFNTAQSIPLIGADTANTAGFTGHNTAVVVLDSGVDYTRPDFGSCSSPGSPAGCRVPVAFDTAPDDGQLDDNGHGTNVSAIVANVASAAQVIGIDVFTGANASSSDIIEGLDWAIANKETYNISAVNMSFSDGVKKTSICNNTFSNPFQTPINTAHGDGIAIVASSGNSQFTNGLEIPACSENAVSTGATYDATSGGWDWGICSDAPATVDTVTCFSNSAGFLSLLAPGAIITAGGYQQGGTSQAAPHVAAAMAIMAQAYSNETPDSWLARLQNAGVPITDSRNGITKSRLDIGAAVAAAMNANDSEEIPFLPPWAFALMFLLIGWRLAKTAHLRK